jgi:hypothetical protein
MKLKRLIKNQRIRIDNHKCGQMIDGNLKNVHFHKTFIGDYDRKFVRIYLNGKLDFSIGFTAVMKSRLKKEIEGVLNDNKEVLSLLAEVHGKAMYDWSEKTITLDRAREYAKSFAESFGLKLAIQKEFIVNVGNSLRRYISIHKDEENNKFSIDQSRQRTYIYPDRVMISKKFEGDVEDLPFYPTH